MGFEDKNHGCERSPGHRKGSHLAVLLIIVVGVVSVWVKYCGQISLYTVFFDPPFPPSAF